MIALARMAANLADARVRTTDGYRHYVGISWKDDHNDPASREYVERDRYGAPASREYYAIIDRITRGETP